MRAPGLPAALLVTALAAGLPYARTFDVPWYFDDFSSIVDEPSVHAADLSAGALAPAVAGFPLQRWLPRLTFAVNHALGGLAPAGWHAVNLAVHALAALLVLLLALEVLARADPGLEPGRRRAVVLLAALLFAVHPLQTMAVTYVVQRMAALCALFTFGALLAWARARREGPAAPGARAGWFALSAACAFLALSSKENAAALPLLVLAFEGLAVGGLGARLRRHALPAAAGAAAVVALLAAAASAYRATLVTERVVSALPLADRLLTQPRVVALYLGRALLPWPGWLHLDDGLRASRGLLDPPATAAALLLLAGLVAGVAWLRRRAPAAAFGLAFFLAALVVEQSVLPLDFVMEHRVYLPMAGLALAAAWGLDRALARWPAGPWPVAVPLLALLAAGTVARNEQWRDPVALHGQDAAAAPWLPRPLLNLAAARYEQGDLEGAGEALLRVVELDPGEAKAWSNLAQIALARGDARLAAQLAQRGLEADAACFTCQQNLGAALLGLRLPAQAVEAFRAAVALSPGTGAAWAGLAEALRQAGREPEARQAAARAAALGAR